jgi:hypothetical protein
MGRPRKRCARCELPPAPPSTRFCAEHRAEHGAMLIGNLADVEARAEVAQIRSRGRHPRGGGPCSSD